jgi:hypothetical protein
MRKNKEHESTGAVRPDRPKLAREPGTSQGQVKAPGRFGLQRLGPLSDTASQRVRPPQIKAPLQLATQQAALLK